MPHANHLDRLDQIMKGLIVLDCIPVVNGLEARFDSFAALIVYDCDALFQIAVELDIMLANLGNLIVSQCIEVSHCLSIICYCR